MASYLYLPAYIIWHYTNGLMAAVRVLFNLLRFIYNFFSLPILFKTLFSPWRRLGEAYPKYISPTEWLSAFAVNTIMRIIGALIRSILIIVGLLALIIFTILGVIVLIVWLLYPVIILSLLTGGLFLIFN